MGALSQLLPFRSSPPRAHTVDHKSPGAPGLASMRLGVVTEGGSQFRERIFLLRDPARWVLAGRWGNSNCSYDGSDLAETFAQAPPPQHPPPPPHTLPHSRGFPVTSGHCVLLGDGSISLAGCLQWQSTGQRRTENEFLPAGETTLEWGAKGGLGEGWGGSCALESRDPKWSGRQRPRAAGSQKSLGRGRAGRPSSLVLPALPRPQPAGYRLGLLYSGYVTPERGSRRRGG